MRTYKNINKKDVIPEFFAQFSKRFRGQLQDREYPLIQIKDALYAFVTTSDILIAAVVTQEVPVLSIYSILFHVVDVLKGSYSDGITAEKIKTNFYSVELMLDTFLDYGYPLITQKFVLESIVKPSGVMEKIEESLLGRHNVHKDQQQTLGKFIDSCSDIRDYAQYRIPDIKGDEELLFDVIEYLDCVIDKQNPQFSLRQGRTIVEEINGEIKMDCNLSGVPEIYIFMNQPKQFSDYSVHECLLNRVDTYEREKVLNLIPPTGTSTIFYYNIKGVAISVPFDFIPKISITENLAKVELKLANRPVRGQSYVIDEFHIKLITPQGLNLSETEMQSGSLSQIENALLWRIGKLEIDQSTKIVANFTTTQPSNLKSGNFIACLKFVINQFSASQTKIDKVEVKNGAKLLTKKAKNMSKSGYYEVRLN